MELPLVGEVIHASPEQPYLGFRLVLDPSIVTSDPSPHETGRQALDYYELAVKGIVTARKGPTGENTLDVEYHALVRDPIAAVGKVHDFFGQPLTADHEACMAEWLKSKNPYDRNRVGQHNYDVASFGISSEELARLAP